MVEEALLDFEAQGWARHTTFAESSGWSTTEAGKAEVERRLAAELDRAWRRDAVTAAHTAFGPLNRRFSTACTDWQIRPTRVDPMAINDHSDWSWDERVPKSLASAGNAFRQLCDELAAVLARFHGYADRYFAALAHVDAGPLRLDRRLRPRLLPPGMDPVPRRPAGHPQPPPRLRNFRISGRAAPVSLPGCRRGGGSA